MATVSHSVTISLGANPELYEGGGVEVFMKMTLSDTVGRKKYGGKGPNTVGLSKLSATIGCHRAYKKFFASLPNGWKRHFPGVPSSMYPALK